MNEIVKFYNKQQVRIVQLNGINWFVAKDVCDVLGISKYRDAVRRLDSDEGCPVLVDTPSGQQEMAAINESGLYSLVLRSHKPEANAFKRWVTHDVLPAINRTGAYIAPNANYDPNIAYVTKIVEESKYCIESNVILAEKNAYLEQFSPKGELGDISSVNGKPKWLQRRGCYVSGHGSHPKRLNPDKGGYLQLDLFLDFIPLKVMEEAMSNIINNTQQLQENNQ